MFASGSNPRATVTDPPALAERLASLRATPAYANYLHVREQVLAMLSAGARAAAAPSLYWQEELENLDYMFDASPLVVAKLRHHCHHLTGIRPYDYRSERDDECDRLAARLSVLREMGADELLVPEPDILGGFGFEIDGGLYNLDTLKFAEASLALEQGGILPILRDLGRRLTVWEIGGGWGGYAHHFKTLLPDTTYVITDLPQVLLFSATYLMTAFPQARVRFHGPGQGVDALHDLDDTDFVFVSHSALAETVPDRLDLTVNMISFQEMTSQQVRDYVSHAHALDCPYLYSFNRERSGYNRELTSVSDLIRERYWAHEVLPAPGSYTKPGVGEGRVSAPLKAQRYKHRVGWRKLVL